MAFTPAYQISNKILTFTAQAEAAKQLIENAPLVPSWERTFQNQAAARSVHHSTAIEGNELEIDAAQKVIAGEKVDTYRVRDLIEIVNYRNVIGFISGYDKKFITISFLLRVHEILGDKLLQPDYIGSFRKQNAVIINSQTADVVFDPPLATELLSELEDLIEWDREKAGEIHPILKAGIIHYEFVRIHPFVDLNGRTARILATWSLYRDGYDIRKFFSLEEYYDQDPKLYYDALDSAHEGDMTHWLEYFVIGFAQELVRIKDKVLKLSKDRAMILKRGQVALNERQIKIMEFIDQNETLKNPDFANLFPDISDDTILRDLKDLIDKGIVKKKGRTRGAYYILA